MLRNGFDTTCESRRVDRSLDQLPLPSCLRMSPRELPIYELEAAIVASVRTRGRLIVQAPTGSGKSTQLPQMLLRHGLLGEGQVRSEEHTSELQSQ